MIKLGVKNETVESEQVVKEQVEKEQVTVTQEEAKIDVNLPKSHLYKRLKKLSSFKQLKKNYKMENQKSIFVNDLKQLFAHLNKEEHKYDTELLVELLNACEDYFVYGTQQERHKSKQDVINELMLPYFDSEEILEKFCMAVSHKVKKSNLVKRILKKMINFFL